MERKDPIYITPCETFVAKDKIRPYGSWIGEYSSIREKYMIKRMWTNKEKFENYKAMWEQENQRVLSYEDVHGLESFLQFFEREEQKKEPKAHQKTIKF